MDSLEARVSGMGKLLLEMALEYDELNQELGYWRKMALFLAVMNLVWIGIFASQVVF